MLANKIWNKFNWMIQNIARNLVAEPNTKKRKHSSNFFFQSLRKARCLGSNNFKLYFIFWWLCCSGCQTNNLQSPTWECCSSPHAALWHPAGFACWFWNRKSWLCLVLQSENYLSLKHSKQQTGSVENRQYIRGSMKKTTKVHQKTRNIFSVD